MALSGVVPAHSGTMQLEGRIIDLKSPADAIREGIGYVPEDRLTEGLFLEKTIQDNVTLPVLDRLRNAFGMISGRRARALRANRSPICRSLHRMSRRPCSRCRVATSSGC
ncbi:hypothetical protein ACFSYD_23340 [Paracoccus aerius]